MQGKTEFFGQSEYIFIFLVVLYHAGLVSESSGLTASFWIVDDPRTSNLIVSAYARTVGEKRIGRRLRKPVTPAPNASLR